MNNAWFFKRQEGVRHYAITMGVGTITDAKELHLLANSTAKAAVEGSTSATCPASIIQMHRLAFAFLDREAEFKLTGMYNDSCGSKIFS
jgi:glucosamine-6-phosphate deaminase